MPEGWEDAPPELKWVLWNHLGLQILIYKLSRHINTLFKIIDGNHRANRYSKNTDPTDVSHWDGGTISGYFPDKKAYQAYLAGIPVAKEVRSSSTRSLLAFNGISYRNPYVTS
jgi:hypothetical protein